MAFTRKVTLELPSEDFRRLERFCFETRQSKQSVLLKLVGPTLRKLAKQEAAAIARRN